MKKWFSLAVVGAFAYAVYRNVTGQAHEEALWREATREFDEGA